MNSRIPEFWARREWVLGEEAKVRRDGWRAVGPLELQSVLRYYIEAKECYVWGAFAGSIVLCTAAIERWLRLRTGNDSGRMKDVIDEAKKRKLISPANAEELHYVREFVRNPPAHGDMVLWMPGYLGLRRTGPGEWESLEGRDGLSPDEAARHTFRVFWRVVDES